MSSLRQDAILRQIGRLFGSGTVSGLSEWQLLNRYVSQGDEAAFEALVGRHGPMVLGVCKRVLSDPHDVEDAFQATFLVLVRKAASLGERDAIGHWLYGVAHRVALKARGQEARRRARLPQVETVPSSAAPDETALDVRHVVDEELRRLPAKYRAPIVLCYLEGLSHEQAALQLQWPVGTVKGRLSRARELLKGRLTRRGFGLSVAVMTTTLSESLAVPETLLASTVANSMRLTTGAAASGVLPASLAVLVEGVLTSMMYTKLKAAGAAGLVLLVLGAGVIAQTSNPGNPVPETTGAEKLVPETPDAEELAPATGHDTKETAKAPATGTTPPPERSLRDLAADIFQQEIQDYTRQGKGDLRELTQSSERILNASGTSPSERITALEEHLKRMEMLEKLAQSRRGTRAGDRAPLVEIMHAKFHRQEAKRNLDLARAGLEGPRHADPKGTPGLKHDPRSEAIHQMLEEPVAMSFANETPLQDLLKYIQSATEGPDGKKIPIYIDPLALKDAGKTMNSPIQLDIEGVPLKTTLTLALKQLGLIYRIKDGLMLITAEDAEDPEPTTPFDILIARLRTGEISDEEARSLTKMMTTFNDIQKLRVEGAKLTAELNKLEGGSGLDRAIPGMGRQ